MKANELNDIFGEFEDVLENKNKYKIEWAFKDAQVKLDTLNEDVINTKLKRECMFCKNQNKINNKFIGLRSESNELLKKQRWYSRLFSNMFALLTILEFITSIILVMAVSKISHSGENWVESQLIGLWIVTIFAFIKVFLEKYYVRPRIDHIGWSLYEKSILSLKAMLVDFNDMAVKDISSSVYEEKMSVA